MEQAEFVVYTVRVLERLQIPYALVGSMASGLYGEGRLTADIDILIDLQPNQIKLLCDQFPSEDYYVSRAAAEEAVRFRKQFNVIHAASGNKVDFMIPSDTEWGRSQLMRRRREQIFVGEPGFVAAPEDLILSKMQYYDEGQSEKHLRDITGMIRTICDSLDYQNIEQWSTKLGVIHVWQAIQARLQMDEGSATDDVPF